MITQDQAHLLNLGEISPPFGMHLLDLTGLKRCASCHIDRHISEFGTNRSYCEECLSDRSRLHYLLYPPAYKTRKNATRNANNRAASGTFTVDEWKLKIEEYNNLCAYCGEDLGDKATVDHDIPLSRGGLNNIENLVPACMKCNITKHSKTGDEFTVLMK